MMCLGRVCPALLELIRETELVGRDNNNSPGDCGLGSSTGRAGRANVNRCVASCYVSSLRSVLSASLTSEWSFIVHLPILRVITDDQLYPWAPWLL